MNLGAQTVSVSNVGVVVEAHPELITFSAISYLN